MTATAGAPEAERAKTRLDQWLWFARLAKSRSIAARLCAGGSVTVNGNTVAKANQVVRVGDVVAVPQGGWQRTVRIAAFGIRRGPATEARTLYDEIAAATPLQEAAPEWEPLLDEMAP